MMKITYVILIVLSLCAPAFGEQAIFTPRTTDMVVIKNMSGGTTTAGIALSGSSSTNALQVADWSSTSKQCIGFSNGVLGQVIVSGKVIFTSGGLTPNTEYYLGSNGTITTTAGTTTPGYVTQKVIRATGTNTGVIISGGGGSGTSTVTDLDGLTDVIISSPASGQFLSYNGSEWVNGTSSGSVAWGGITGSISSQTDLQTALNNKVATSTTVATTAPLTGGGDLSTNRTISIPKATGTQSGYLDSADHTSFSNKQAALGYTPENSANKAAASGYASLDSDSKVVQNPANGTSTPGANKIVMSDDANKIDAGWLSVDLDDMTDVTISSPSTDQVLKYNGSAWVNGAGGAASVSQVIITGLSGGTTTVGKALYFSATDTLAVATHTGSHTAAIGFSTGSTGEIIVSGKVTGLSGLSPGLWYVLSSNGDISLTGVSTSGYIVQTVLYSTGTSTGIICIQPPIVN